MLNRFWELVCYHIAKEAWEATHPGSRVTGRPTRGGAGPDLEVDVPMHHALIGRHGRGGTSRVLMPPIISTQEGSDILNPLSGNLDGAVVATLAALDRAPRPGDVLHALVVMVSEDHVLVDVGYSAEGVIVKDGEDTLNVTVGEYVRAEMISLNSDGSLFMRLEPFG